MDLVFDVATATLLLREAQWQLVNEDDGRKALVARRFIETRFGDDTNYGITTDEPPATTDDIFDSIVKYASVEPESVFESLVAAD